MAMTAGDSGVAAMTGQGAGDDRTKIWSGVHDGTRLWSGSHDGTSTTGRKASGFLRMLQDEDFQFFLQLFHQIMPHVDMMYQQLQKKDIDAVFIKEALQNFTMNVQTIRDQSSFQEQELQQVATETTRSRKALGEEKQRLSKKICDTILNHTKERFSFTDHLVSATLLQGERFEQHCHMFPVVALNITVRAYPTLNKVKLKTELSLIYDSPEFKGCCGALALYQVLLKYNLQDTFSETVTLLNILITTPMTTAEAERCFSTLKRIKTFLRNVMGQERLNALAMLSMERELVRNMPAFNERICDTILNHTKERFSFTDHLVSATLLQGERFEQHCHMFPVVALNITVRAYPTLNKVKLKTELSLIYDSPEFKGCCGALALYQVLLKYNLQDTFSETVTLLNILITTPMTTAEAERCFSTLKRIKTFLRNVMGQERLNALAMLSMERELVRNMPAFNERVIERFAALKERRAKCAALQ
ncbi:uncharacterized protein [Sinocyclocheilus grahami]|uniref:uncharacterized protein n=1 Tax=Sinocyclocheilus grahami TaxID=75366 RepID=UPI0007AC7FBA|nr:PREDICTED: uncharacterized protein LOC107575449 [Sinocyclocheilus grahami]